MKPKPKNTPTNYGHITVSPLKTFGIEREEWFNAIEQAQGARPHALETYCAKCEKRLNFLGQIATAADALRKHLFEAHGIQPHASEHLFETRRHRQPTTEYDYINRIRQTLDRTNL